MKRKRRKSSWKAVRRYIAQEIHSNEKKRHKRPWNQVVAIGLARARKAGYHVNPTGEGHGKRYAAGGRRQAHSSGFKQVGQGGLWAVTREGRKKK